MPRANNVMVCALAGTGKTTTMAETFRRAAGVKSKLIGSPEQEAIWKSTNCSNSQRRGMMAFNNSIKEEWKRLEIPGLEVNSTFGFGLKVLKMNGVGGKMDPDKTEKLLHDIDPRLNNKKCYAIKRLVELARLTLTANDYELLQDLSNENCITIDEQGIDYTQDLLEKHVDNLDMIDYADMVWLPYMLGKKIRPFDFLGVDECQDLNRAQHELIMGHANRLMLVGDERQAIYQFAGADEQSYQVLREWLQKKPLGMLELPLTISRRCPQAVAELAREIVPNFRCLPDAIEGSVTEHEPMEWLKGIKRLDPNHMVVARKNAPVVQTTLSLLRLRKPAKMLGRSFGSDVDYYLKGMSEGSNDTGTVLVRVQRDLADKRATWATAKFISDKVKENYTDIAQSAIVFCEMCSTMQEVYKTISDIFVDVKDNPKNVIRLSSVHRAKGLEARYVHFLDHDVTGVPHMVKKRKIEPKQADINLRYIAITRTQESLSLVRALPESKD